MYVWVYEFSALFIVIIKLTINSLLALTDKYYSPLKYSLHCGMYLLNPSTTDRMWPKVNFLAEHSYFEFRVFLLLNWFVLSRLENTIYPNILLTAEEEKIWAYGFSNSIRAKWNANSPFQVFNLFH